MRIERFFGKGREPQVNPRAKEEDKAGEKDQNKPKSRRSTATSRAVGAEPSVPRAEPAGAPARAGAAAVAMPALKGVSAAPTRSVEFLPEPSYEEIATRAYTLWVNGGRLAGRDRENWIEAERQLRAERASG
jgi:hypothetical protein